MVLYCAAIGKRFSFFLKVKLFKLYPGLLVCDFACFYISIYIYIYIYIYIPFILLIWEFFISALADGFPVESEWQQVCSSLHDSS